MAAATGPSPPPSSETATTGLGRMASMEPECTPLKHRYDHCFNLWFEEYLGVDKTRPSGPSTASRTTEAPSTTLPTSSSPTQAPSSPLPPSTFTTDSPRDAPTAASDQVGKRSWFSFWSRAPTPAPAPESSSSNPASASASAPASASGSELHGTSSLPAQWPARQRQSTYTHLPADPAAAAAHRADLKAKFDDCNALFQSYQTCVRAAVRERNLEHLIEEARVYNPFPFPSTSTSSS